MEAVVQMALKELYVKYGSVYKARTALKLGANTLYHIERFGKCNTRTLDIILKDLGWKISVVKPTDPKAAKDA